MGRNWFLFFSVPYQSEAGTRDKVPPKLSILVDKTVSCNEHFTVDNDDNISNKFQYTIERSLLDFRPVRANKECIRIDMPLDFGRSRARESLTPTAQSNFEKYGLLYLLYY